MQCYLSILFVCLFVFSCDVNGKPFPQTAEPSSEVDITIFSEIENIKKETSKKVDTVDNVRKGAKQGDDDDDSDASSATNTDNAAGNTGTAAAATQNPVALPVQLLVNSIIVPATQVVGSSIIRAVASPFEFLGKQVDQFVNPSTTTKKPPKTKAPVVTVTPEPPKKLEGQITYFVISPDEPAPQRPAPAPVAIRRRPAPVVAPRVTSAPITSKDNDDDEENEAALAPAAVRRPATSATSAPTNSKGDDEDEEDEAAED